MWARCYNSIKSLLGGAMSATACHVTPFCLLMDAVHLIACAAVTRAGVQGCGAAQGRTRRSGSQEASGS